MLIATSDRDKLHWAFQLYDRDSSGAIEMKEMVEVTTRITLDLDLPQQVFGSIYENEGLDRGMAVERAQVLAPLQMRFDLIFHPVYIAVYISLLGATPAPINISSSIMVISLTCRNVAVSESSLVKFVP